MKALPSPLDTHVQLRWANNVPRVVILDCPIWRHVSFWWDRSQTSKLTARISAVTTKKSQTTCPSNKTLFQPCALNFSVPNSDRPLPPVKLIPCGLLFTVSLPVPNHSHESLISKGLYHFPSPNLFPYIHTQTHIYVRF